MGRWRARRLVRTVATLAVAVGVVAAPAGAQPRPEAGTVRTFVPPATLLGDDGKPAAGGPATAGSPCSIPNITASPSGDAIYFSNGGRSDVFRMTTADRQGRSAGEFSIFNFPDMPYPNNPRQSETHVHDLAVAPDGTLWVVNVHRRPGPTGRAAAVVEFSPTLERLRTIDIPNEPEVGNQSFTGGITVAPNGDVWLVSSEFTGPEEITLVRRDGSVRTYVITPEDTPGPSLQGPLVFANGYVWATGVLQEFNRDTADPTDTRATNIGVVVRLDPNAGTVTRETITPSTDPQYYPAGTAPTASAPFTTEVVRNAGVTLFDQHAGYVPGRIVVGPDGDLWYVEQQRVLNPAWTPTSPRTVPRFFTGATGRIARLDPATGQVTHYQLPAGSNPTGLTFGGDGAIWFTSDAPAAGANNPTGARAFIGRLDPATGQVTEFAAPAGATNLRDIDTGQAGDVYFSFRTAEGECAIGQIWVCSGNAGQGQGQGNAPCAPGRVMLSQGETGQRPDNPGGNQGGGGGAGQGQGGGR